MDAFPHSTFTMVPIMGWRGHLRLRCKIVLLHPCPPLQRQLAELLPHSASGMSNVNTPFARRKPVQTFQRSIQIVEPIGSVLQPQQVVYLRLSQEELSVPKVQTKLQEHVNAEGAFILTDSRGSELLDCAGTQGKEFWKSQTRKIYAMTEENFTQYLEAKRSKRSKTLHRNERNDEMVEKLQEVEDIINDVVVASENLLKLKSVTSAVVCLNLKPQVWTEIVKELACLICKAPVEEPVVGGCCQSLLGCKMCTQQWFLTSAQCPKCRSEEGREKQIVLRGLDNTFRFLKPLSNAEN